MRAQADSARPIPDIARTGGNGLSAKSFSLNGRSTEMRGLGSVVAREPKRGIGMPDLGELFGSFFEAAATLALLFIVIGWVSSKLVELGQGFVNAHGRMLRDELQRCFGGPRAEAFTRYFYWHPLVEPLSQPRIRRLPRWLRRSDAPEGYPPDRLPSYIAPETFAAVMLNPFPWPATAEPLRLFLIGNLEEDDARELPEAVNDLPSDLSTKRKFVDAAGNWDMLLIDAGRIPPEVLFDKDFRESPVNIHADPPNSGAGGIPSAPPVQIPAEMLDRLARVWGKNKIVPAALRTRMMALIQDAEGDIDRLRANVARWYAETMDRVTGRFKRKALLYVSFVAFAICLLFNVNAIGIFSSIVENSDRRASIERAMAAGGTTEETATLAAKEQFAAAVKDCGPSRPASDACLIDILRSLWRSPEHPNLVRAIAFDPPYDSKAWQKGQLRRVRNYCLSGKRAEFCGSSLVVDLNACIDGLRDSKGEPLVPPPPGSAGRAEWDDKVDGICREAWNDTWRSPAFFWDAATASRVAAHLFDRRRMEARQRDILETRLRTRLGDVRDEAVKESRRIRAITAEVPGAGFIWSGDRSLLEHIQDRFLGIFGILIAALLAAFGAPFWYDLLGRISRRGATGPKPDGA